MLGRGKAGSSSRQEAVLLRNQMACVLYGREESCESFSWSLVPCSEEGWSEVIVAQEWAGGKTSTADLKTPRQKGSAIGLRCPCGCCSRRCSIVL